MQNAIDDAATRQNSQKGLTYLCAMRLHYERVKVIRAVELIFVVVVPVVLSALLASRGAPSTGQPSPLAIFASGYAFVILVVDAVLFVPLQDSNRRKGAQCSEQFDEYVLGLKIPDTRRPLDPEDLAGITASMLASPRADKLKDWYDRTLLEELPPLPRVIACQRSNCTWDLRLRGKYANLVITVAAVAAAGLFFYALSGWSAGGFVTSVLFPLTPALVWAIREARAQREAGKMNDSLREIIKHLWRECMSHNKSDAKSDAELLVACADVQTALFYLCSDYPPVPDWLYWSNRKRLHNESRQAAAEWILEAHSAGWHAPAGG